MDPQNAKQKRGPAQPAVQPMEDKPQEPSVKLSPDEITLMFGEEYKHKKIVLIPLSPGGGFCYIEKSFAKAANKKKITNLKSLKHQIFPSKIHRKKRAHVKGSRKNGVACRILAWLKRRGKRVVI